MNSKEQFEYGPDSLLVRAPAKINLLLLIAGKRPDGFHELETVMAKVNLYDELLFEHTSKPGIQLVCKGKYDVDCGDDNLIIKACKAMGVENGIKITLEKNISLGAGLGGGSSDAAATLMGLNKFCNLNKTEDFLHEAAASLGSDINFFLGGPVAFCTGRGEKIQKINKKIEFFAALVFPGVNTSTEKVYSNYLHEIQLYKKVKTEKLTPLLKNKIDFGPQICANMLEYSCYDLHPGIADLKNKLMSLDIGKVCLSGSGSTIFVMFDSLESSRVSQLWRKLQDNVRYDSLIVSNNRW